MALKKHSVMTGEELKGWRKAQALTQSEAAKALGLKLRMIQHYEKGSHKIPRTLALACWAMSKGKQDFNGAKAKAMKEPLALILAGDDEKLRAKKEKKLEKLAAKAD